MSTVGTDFWTQLDLQEISRVFQQAAEESRGAGSKSAGWMAKLSGNSGDLEFFKPVDDSPFSELDSDPEDFAVGVHIPKMSGGAKGAVRTVQMFVWDRGDWRQVTLVSPHGMTEGRGANKLIESFVRSFQIRDTHLQLIN